MADDTARTLRFDDDDLHHFAHASRDENPLHRDPRYARATAFGAPVVYGALGGLAALGQLAPRPGQQLSRLALEFAGPLFVGVDYTAEVDESSPHRAKVRLRDGRRVVLRLTARFVDGSPDDTTLPNDTHHGPEEPQHAVDWPDHALVPGVALTGRYAARGEALAQLLDRYQLRARGVSPRHAEALLGCSYLVGMRLPGRRALFSDVTLDFDAPTVAADDGFTLQLDALHADFGMASLSASFAARIAARAQMTAFVRRPVTAPALDTESSPDDTEVDAEALRGKVAVVTGASRGLGAALAQALAQRGCTVVGTWLHSAAEAEALGARIAAQGGRFEALQADASDPRDAARLAEHIATHHGGLDLLVCNACPALRPLWIDPASAARITDHIAQSVAMVAHPLAHLLAPLERRKGIAVVISSSALDAPPAEWPHYVAAKRAVEGLAEVAAVEHPGVKLWIARPPKLLTELVNTPMGRHGATDPAAYASTLVDTLLGTAPASDAGLRALGLPSPT